MASLLNLLLVGALLAATISFAVMGASHARRRRWLARKANRMGMRFSADDPFDVPIRYRRFALIRAGHSPKAANVAYGRVDGWSVRSFDFRYEIGHGTGRVTRRYWAIVVEAEAEMPRASLWNDLDRGLAPLEATAGAVRAGPWWRGGEKACADALWDACEAVVGDGASAQTSGNLLMICAPVLRGRTDYTPYYSTAVRAAAAVARLSSAALAPPAAPDCGKDATEP
ncbi:MAG: hypothetical protein ACE15C_03060 [Phycisphaerae bacterium]